MPTIREQIEPHIRAATVAATARASGVNRVSLQNWLAGRRRLADTQIEAVCRALRLKIKIGRRRPPSVSTSPPPQPPVRIPAAPARGGVGQQT